jgi:hypothetical protein
MAEGSSRGPRKGVPPLSRRPPGDVLSKAMEANISATPTSMVRTNPRASFACDQNAFGVE